MLIRDELLSELVETPLDIGLLHRCRERIPGHPPGFAKACEVATLAQLGNNAKLDGASAGLPAPVAIAVALPRPNG